MLLSCFYIIIEGLITLILILRLTLLTSSYSSKFLKMLLHPYFISFHKNNLHLTKSV